LRDVEIVVSPAPKSALDIDDRATLITVGSIGYNMVSREVEQNFEPGARLDPNGHILFADGMQYWGSDYAVVEKCYSSERKQWAFYVAGPTRIGTTGAFSYLILRWPDLRRIFGDKSPFSIAIRVLDGDPSRCEVVHRFPHRPPA
jgi:hypothetical protein